MRFNPQMMINMLLQRNPNAMAQIQQLQQVLNSNPQMRQQYNTFRNNMMANPNLQQQAMEEAMAKINGTATPAQTPQAQMPTTTNNNINIVGGTDNRIG